MLYRIILNISALSMVALSLYAPDPTCDSVVQHMVSHTRHPLRNASDMKKLELCADKTNISVVSVDKAIPKNIYRLRFQLFPTLEIFSQPAQNAKSTIQDALKGGRWSDFYDQLVSYIRLNPDDYSFRSNFEDVIFGHFPYLRPSTSPFSFIGANMDAFEAPRLKNVSFSYENTPGIAFSKPFPALLSMSAHAECPPMLREDGPLLAITTLPYTFPMRIVLSNPHFCPMLAQGGNQSYGWGRFKGKDGTNSAKVEKKIPAFPRQGPKYPVGYAGHGQKIWDLPEVPLMHDNSSLQRASSLGCTPLIRCTFPSYTHR